MNDSPERPYMHEPVKIGDLSKVFMSMELTASRRLRRITERHVPDAMGRCVACDHQHPCPTYQDCIGGNTP